MSSEDSVEMERDASRETSRRGFLRQGAALGLAASLPASGLLGCQEALDGKAGAAEASDSASGPFRLRRTYGATGVEIPPVSFGTFSLKDGDEELVRRALDLGITHFDTADGYGEGRAETILGRALGADRQRATITTKQIAPATASLEALNRSLEDSLRRLNTDHVDIYLNHAVDSFDRLRNPAWPEFIARAKEAGKIRASGLSGHGPSLVPIVREALETEWLDALLVAYNYIQTPSYLTEAKIRLQQMTGRLDWVALQPELPGVLASAKAKNVGVMTMKTLRGARHNDLRPFERNGSTFAQAAIRWVLAQDNVDGLVITIPDEAKLDEYVAVVESESHLARRPEDLSLLVGYEALNYERQCVQGCGDCAGLCPAGVPIADTLRLNMYARDYGQPTRARNEYQSLGARASLCLTCDGAPCADACATGVQIPGQMKEAALRLG